MTRSLEVSSLSSPERFVLWSLRLALAPNITSEEAQPALAEGFRVACIPDALPLFVDMTDLLIVLWHETQRVPEIHCTCCRAVGVDEWHLLQVLAALQSDDAVLAARHLGHVLPLTGVRSTLPRATRVADALRRAGWVLRLIAADIPSRSEPVRTTLLNVLH